jgi:hypothetical protein
MTDSEKLRALAKWFDITDAMKNKELFDNEVQIDLRAMADRIEQSHKPVVSGKWLAETLTKFLSEFRKYYNNGKEPIRLREEAFIEIWAHQFSAACASGAVDKTVSADYCNCEFPKYNGSTCSRCDLPYK